MHIAFDNLKHQELANDHASLGKRYNKKGRPVADEILNVLDVLRAAPSLYDVPRGYRPHPLSGNFKGCFATNVTKTHRVIFKPNHSDDPTFRIYNHQAIKKIIILELYYDYH